MPRSTGLGEKSIPRLLIAYSTPAIVGMVAQALYNLADRVFVGRAVGPLGIAGATVTFPLMLVIMAFGMLIGFGAASLISIRLGQKRRDDAQRVLGNATVLLVGMSLLMTGGGLVLLDPVLVASGASRDILPFARDYAQIIVVGCVFQLVGFGLNAAIRGEGSPWVAMYTMLIGAVTNVVLDPLFLFVFGWGMKGAAAATVIAQGISAVWVVWHFLSGRSQLALRAADLRLARSTCKAIFLVGSPMFAMQLTASVINVLLNNQLRAYGGDLAISAMGIVYAVIFFIAMPIFGINQGAQPIIGYNYGARKYRRVTRTLLLAILAATAVTTTGFLVVTLFPEQVVALFNREDPSRVQDEALRQLGVQALRTCVLMFPIVGFQIVSASYFQAVGKPKHSLLLSLSRQVFLLIPAVLLLPRWFGLAGLWAAFPAADLGSSLVTGVWLVFELRHLDRRHAETTPDESAIAVIAEYP